MKKKILYIVHHRKNRSPGQRYRFEQYLGYLESSGFEYTLSPLLNEKDDKTFYSKGNYFGKLLIFLKCLYIRWKDVRRADNYDIIFIYREAFMTGSTYFERQFHKSKAKLIFDFDDSIWIDNVSRGNKSLAWLKNAQKTSEIIGYCDMVFAGNEYLAEYARQYNNNVVIVPTTIDTDAYVPNHSNHNDKKTVIGWTGSHTTIEHFKLSEPVLHQIKERYGDRVAFSVLGDADYRNSDLQIEGIAWTPQNEVSVLNTFDIGIMPLPDDKWAQGKCACKGLQYMAVEVPTIMSPVGVNKDVVKDGENGFLAISNDEWVDKLSALIESPALREKLGKNGRKTVIDDYSVLSLHERYVGYYKSLVGL